MVQQHVYEGTSSELAPYLAQRPNQRFRLIELPIDLPEESDKQETEKPVPVPNEAVLAMLREIAVMKIGMAPTDGAETDRLLRQARAGAMYGDSSQF